MPYELNVERVFNMQITQEQAGLLTTAINFMSLPSTYEMSDRNRIRLKEMGAQLNQIKTYKEPNE